MKKLQYCWNLALHLPNIQMIILNGWIELEEEKKFPYVTLLFCILCHPSQIKKDTVGEEEVTLSSHTGQWGSTGLTFSFSTLFSIYMFRFIHLMFGPLHCAIPFVGEDKSCVKSQLAWFPNAKVIFDSSSLNMNQNTFFCKCVYFHYRKPDP